MGVVRMDVAAWLRQRKTASRAACYVCGLRVGAACHIGSTPETWWWQHAYEPGILTRCR